ncbi:hypothetical protein ASF61_20080 [Duganella sp. Leaf126]|uniref:hypothetical protein n=1 Tax=Duganella sp. Leaf126 TaxID=1736266 RepID=UPI0006FBAA1A|nr:hypothetical protein [Duganella sp. Leaf126]KQQ45268.1 hypothetical protein ASF61_20080 [Duganella sp. Leaf126]
MAIRTLNVTWNAADGSTGSATAVITLDTDLVTTSPGNTIPIGQIQDLTVTVQGARAGNGTYGKADYTGVQFYAGFALDFSQELVGQTGDAGSLAYGTADAQGGAGDFNLASAGGATAPAGVAAFTLATNGRSDPSDVLVVASIRP